MIPTGKKPRAARSSIERSPAKAATGIPGVDEITGGGLPRGCTTLLGGGPGSGKTIRIGWITCGARGEEMLPRGKAQTVAASLSAPRLSLIANHLSRIQILARVGESDIVRIRQGQQGAFTVQALQGRRFPAPGSRFACGPRRRTTSPTTRSS